MTAFIILIKDITLDEQGGMKFLIPLAAFDAFLMSTIRYY